MGQVTIYLDDTTIHAMKQAANDEGVSQSQWVAKLIKNKTRSEWPVNVRQLAGSWQDFPDTDTLRATTTNDIPRETL